MTGKVRPVRLGPLPVSLERRQDGSVLVSSTVPVSPHPARMTDLLEHWARHEPCRVFLAKRTRAGDGEWRGITYAETLASVRRIAAALLARGLVPERPVVLLSENDIEHGLMSLAAMSGARSSA